MGTEVTSQEKMCKEYRLGDMTRNQIAVFRSLKDISDESPKKLKEIIYRSEYVKQPHVRGSFGQYPPPDYELGISFEINIDTGQPVPQNSQSYTKKYETNRDFSVKIKRTWSPLALHLPSQAALPLDGSITVEDYRIIGEKYGMLEVSYISAIEQKGGDDYAHRTNRSSDFFLERRGREFLAFMKCQRSTDAVKIPHCEHFQIIDGFLTRTRFKRSLLNEFETIRRRSTDFVTCIFEES